MAGDSILAPAVAVSSGVRDQQRVLESNPPMSAWEFGKCPALFPGLLSKRDIITGNLAVLFNGGKKDYIMQDREAGF